MIPQITAQKAIELTKVYIHTKGYGHTIDLSTPPSFYAKEEGNYWLVHTFLEYEDHAAIRDGYLSPGVQKEYRTYRVNDDTLEVK